MKTKNIERYLESFGKYLVKQARTNLTKGTEKYGTKNQGKTIYKNILLMMVRTNLAHISILLECHHLTY